MFVHKDLKDYQAHATKWQVFKYHCRNGVRRLAMLALFASTIASGGLVWREVSPVTVYAEKVVEVTASSTMPVMLQKICKAENPTQKQFNKDGSVFRGSIDKSDIGLCQINERYNNDYARKLGYDIFTEQGNKDFATILYNERGVQPWEASKCIAHGWGWDLGYCKQ